MRTLNFGVGVLFARMDIKMPIKVLQNGSLLKDCFSATSTVLAQLMNGANFSNCKIC